MGVIRKIEVEIEIDEDRAAEVDHVIESGEFETVDDVVRHAFDVWWHERMMKDPANVLRLRRLWKEGLASGEPVEVTDGWFEDIKRRGRERVKALREGS